MQIPRAHFILVPFPYLALWNWASQTLSKCLMCGCLSSFSFGDAGISWLQETCFRQLTIVDAQDANHWFAKIQGLYSESSWHLECSVILFYILFELPLLSWLCSGHGGVYRCGWYFCGCGELWWNRQAHQKLPCCWSSVMGLSDFICTELAQAWESARLPPSPTWKEKHVMIIFGCFRF